MYQVSKKFEFCASHKLEGLEHGHPCQRIHGHNYEVEFVFEAEELDETGMVIDYRKMEPIKQFLDTGVDHRHLNDFWEFNPTAENIARELFKIGKKAFPQLRMVKVSETPKTTATYYEL